jgi:hypothetical protein
MTTTSLQTISTTVLAVLATLTLGMFLGYQAQKIKRSLRRTRRQLHDKLQPMDEPEEAKPTSSLIDPNDLVQRAQYEQDEIVRKFNQ